MGTYNIHAGRCPQGQGAGGAVGYLKESVEDRAVKNLLISNFRSQGNTVYDCTDDTNCTARQNLQRIVAKCNAHSDSNNLYVLNHTKVPALLIECCFVDNQTGWWCS